MVAVSAGVYSRELDLSVYVPRLSTTRLAVIGGATKGPVNVPTLVTSEADLIRTFGKPVDTDFGLHGAIHAFRQLSALTYLRVANSPVTATVTVEDAGNDDVFDIDASSPGSWGNDVRVIVGPGTNQGYKLTVEAPIDNEGTLGQVEQFDNLLLTPAASPDYIETVVNEGIVGQSNPSQYIRIDVIDGSLTPVAGTYSLSTGDDGISGLTAADYIGSYVGQTATGLQALANAEMIDLNLIIVPGYSDPDFLTGPGGLFDTVQSRGDCMAIIDSPFGLNAQGVADWHNGVGYPHSAFNTSYAALYWSWFRTYDRYTKKRLWLPPSGAIAAQYAYTDTVAQPWFAPAGLNRGLVQIAQELEMSPNLAQRDVLQGNGNAVNPLVSFQFDGVTILGARTLQRKPTALDRVGPRRGLLYLRKALASVARYLLFEPHDDKTWRQYEDMARVPVEFMKKNRGLYDARVRCDASTNPPELIDQNVMGAKLFLKPTKTAEIIEQDFVILSTGAQFPDV